MECWVETPPIRIELSRRLRVDFVVEAFTDHGIVVLVPDDVGEDPIGIGLESQ